MRYKFNGKNINIPDAVIDHGMKKEGMTRQAVIDRYLSDEGHAVDPTVVALTEKAKAAGIKHDAQGDKPKRKAPERKPDEVKRGLIAALAAIMAEDANVANLEITNIERMLAFEYLGEKYELTLVRKRKPKE